MHTMSFVISQRLIWYGERDVPVGVSWVVPPLPLVLKDRSSKHKTYRRETPVSYY